MADENTPETGTTDLKNLFSMPRSDESAASQEPKAVRVLLLDDDPANLLLRSAILRQNGYESLPASTIEEANELLESTDIAVLDYHLGAGKFGTAVAAKLRQRRPEVPIIILSATLERRFGGVEDMHLLKGHSSVEDLLSALRGLEAKRRGSPVVVDAREFYYSRIAMAIGIDVLVQILDPEGNWHYVNESAAEYLQKPRDWFPGRNIFAEMAETMRDWRDVLYAVSTTRETYIDRTRRGLLTEPREDEGNATWSVLAFPIMLHDGRSGVVLSARILERHSGNSFA
ncbi:response regulator [Terriglobus roseus]|nr:response regulator [Terriglobus roseus]